MARTMEVELRSHTAQARRAARGVNSRLQGMALASIVRLLEPVYRRRQQQQTGAQPNRDVADPAWRSLERGEREPTDPAGEYGRTPRPVGRDAAKTQATPTGAADESAPRESGGYADIPAGRGTAIQYIGTYYGYKPDDAAANTETRTGD